MYNGRIYYSFGFGGSARGNADAIRIYDVSEAKQLKALDLSTTAFAAFEPECCCFYQGKLALSLQNRDIWIFDYIKGLDQKFQFHLFELVLAKSSLLFGERILLSLFIFAAAVIVDHKEGKKRPISYHSSIFIP